MCDVFADIAWDTAPIYMYENNIIVLESQISTPQGFTAACKLDLSLSSL